MKIVFFLILYRVGVIMIDDTLISVDSTSPTLIKTFRINNANIFNGCNVNISAWNDSASSQTILNLTYNNITYS